NLEVIVVDNASTENPTRLIKETYPNAHLIISEKNLGFTGGNNLGIRNSTGDYIFIVNNDTEVTTDLLNHLIEAFNVDPKIGMVSPKIKYFSNKDIIQYAGFSEIHPITGRGKS